MMSQCEVASSRAGPKASAPREDGAGGGDIVDRDLERAEMAVRRADRALHHRELGDAAGASILRPREHHGHVEMLLEQAAASIARSSRP